MARIINKAHFKRLNDLVMATKGDIVHGGKEIDERELFIEPTVVINVTEDDILMQDELFGPILPVMPYKRLEDVRDMVRRVDEHPLAVYIMSEDQSEIDWALQNIRAGDCSVNGESSRSPFGLNLTYVLLDVLAHVAVPMPFGGQGQSGMGKHRGKGGFLAFSSEMSTATVSTATEAEAMLDFRYKDGDADAKWNMWKQYMEPPLP